MLCHPSFLSMGSSKRYYIYIPNEAKTATSPDEMDTLPMDTLELELETELCKQLENIMIDVDAVKGSNSLEASDPGHRRQADKEGLPMCLENPDPQNSLAAYNIICFRNPFLNYLPIQRCIWRKNTYIYITPNSCGNPTIYIYIYPETH